MPSSGEASRPSDKSTTIRIRTHPPGSSIIQASSRKMEELTVHIIVEEKMLLRDKMLDALSDEKKDKFQKVRVGVYPQAPTQTREGQAPPTRFELGHVCAVAETRPPLCRHDNITVGTSADSVVTGIGKRRCGDGGEHVRSDGSQRG
jgi:hypothetical protein